MIAKDDLFQLIKALSNSEKRYFKIFASRHTYAEEHNLVGLFDEVDSLDEYDEDKLKKKLLKKKNNASMVKYLSAEKKALHDLIMRGMRAFHGEKTVDVQLHDLMVDEIFYHGKSLYELQAKTLYKAKKLAVEYEKFPALLILLQREAKMLIERKTKDYDEVRSRVHKEEREVVEKLINEFELRILKDDLFIDTRAGANIRDEFFLSVLDKKVKHPLLNSEDNALSFQAKKHYHRIWGSYMILKLNRQKSWEHTRKIVDLFEANPNLRDEFSLEYKIALANYLGECHATKKYEDFEEIIKNIKALPTKSYDEDGEVFQNVYFFELLYYMNNNRFADAVKIIPEIEEGMRVYVAKVNKARELTFYYNIAVLFFLMENWKESLRWVNKIIDDKSDSRKDIQNFARVMQVIIQYELGNAELLEYISRSAYRYLEREKNLHSFERLLLIYLKKLPFALDNKELLKSFTSLKEEIVRLKNTPGERAYIGMEELVIWLRSKIENKKMEQVMKELS
jgi:hypothetical protein